MTEIIPEKHAQLVAERLTAMPGTGRQVMGAQDYSDDEFDSFSLSNHSTMKDRGQHTLLRPWHSACLCLPAWNTCMK